jgi:hypothetical protein
MRPRFKEIEKRYPHLEFSTYDIDLDEESSTYNVGNILPVLILFDDNENELCRIIGEHKTEKLVERIEEFL